ncbi:MAG: MFS transporter, partial [Lachnospiraceae bacterium]|nr:MFS transporter [Lachnospiraceae bacterium]
MFHLLLAVIYLSFISLGLPDGLLGAAWPIMHPQLSVPVSYAGLLSLLISCCTILSSLASDRLTRKLGTARLTAFSVAMTALALFGFSFSSSIFELCFWAIPYGLGAGSVDAALNNYVAIHYASRHMSWLHCMWGVGASIGPYIMGFALSGGNNWPMGYRYIGFLQVILTILLFLSLPLWKQQAKTYEQENTQVPALPLHKILMLPGAKEVMITFFCYCALEQTTALWASSYLVLNHDVDAKLAASLGSLFF